jgi:ankyrin repeat protein
MDPVLRFFQESTNFVTWAGLFDDLTKPFLWLLAKRTTGGPLYYAALSDLQCTAQRLLSQGANVDALGGKYGNGLQAASANGHIEMVRLLLTNGANVNAGSGKYGGALQAASSLGRLEIVHLLLESGADINALSSSCGTSLQIASCKGNIQLVRLFLLRGADVNCPGGDWTGTALTCASLFGDLEIVELLLANSAKSNELPFRATSRSYADY